MAAKSTVTLQAEISSQLPTNGSELITAAILRGVLGDIIASYPNAADTPPISMAGTLTTAGGFSGVSLILSGSVSGTTTITAASTAGGTLTLPAITDTLVARSSTDTLVNKTIDTAAPNTVKINGNTLNASAGAATVTIPNVTGTLVGRSTTDTLTNKTIDGTQNTLLNIGAGQLAAIGSGTVLANSTGGTAVPAAITVSALLDIISPTQGTILYRGAGSWTFLGTGSNGQFLTSGGAGANVSWSNATGTGTVNSGTAGQVATYGSSGTTISGVAMPQSAPQGRITLTSGVPVISGAVAASGVIYYTPYLGNIIPLWNGTYFVPTVFSELTNTLANTSSGNAGPNPAINNSVYDLYVWSNSGTPTLTRSDYWQTTATVTNTNASPAVFTQAAHGYSAATPIYLTVSGGSLSPGFTSGTIYYASGITTNTYTLSAQPGAAAINAGGASSGTITATASIGNAVFTTTSPARGTGPGQTRVSGILTNTNAITNGPGAGAGTYVGTFRTDIVTSGAVTNAVSWSTGGTASGGVLGSMNFWNMYNRIQGFAAVLDSGAPYSGLSAGGYRQPRASVNNQVNFVIGQAEDSISATYTGQVTLAATIGAEYYNSIQLDQTASGGVLYLSQNAIASGIGIGFTAANLFGGLSTLGAHFIAPLEGSSNGSNILDSGQSNEFTARITY